MLDKSFTNVDEIESYLQTPVIGTVPEIKYLVEIKLEIIMRIQIINTI